MCSVLVPPCLAPLVFSISVSVLLGVALVFDRLEAELLVVDAVKVDLWWRVNEREGRCVSG